MINEMIILNTPDNRKFFFYQCVDYNCYRITTRIYTALERSRLMAVPNDIPEILHKPYLYFQLLINGIKSCPK